MLTRYALLLNFLLLPAHAQEPVWRVALVGDVMLGTDYPNPTLPPREGRGLLDAPAPILQRAQLAIGNLEGTIGVGGTSSKHGARCYAFRTPPALVGRLREAGFDWWSQANNHARDFGEQGARTTQQWLMRADMDATGPAHTLPLRMQAHGRSICLLAYAPNTGMNDLRDIPTMQTQVKRAKQQCDLVVVSFHGGGEGSDKSHTPRGVERYLGENRGDVRAFAHRAIDAGAGLVFGHGPHVARGMELYQGHLIAYSLGNFMTFGGMNVSGVLGMSALLELDLAGNGTLVDGAIHSFRQANRGPLQPDPNQSVAKLMAQRTREDFGGGGLQFDSDGRFFPEP